MATQLPPQVVIPEKARGAGTDFADPDGDPVLYWNDQLLRAAFEDSRRPQAEQEQGGPTRVSRAAAIVHAALHDAVAGTLGGYEPYLVRGRAPGPARDDAGARAAAGAAAYTALTWLYPSRAVAQFDPALNAYFDGTPTPANLGFAYGLAVGGAYVLARQDDGSGPWVGPPPFPPPPPYPAFPAGYNPPPLARDPDDDLAAAPPYRQKETPGEWRSDPLDLDPVAGPQNPVDPGWGAVRPFTFGAGPQFRPVPFPEPDADAYRDAFQDVKERGDFEKSTPASRAAAFFWSYDDGLGSPIRLYNRVVWQVLATNSVHLLADRARLLALVNLAMADAGVVIWEAKFAYNHWRPVEGVRRAGEFNTIYGTALDQDADWRPVGRPQNSSRRPHTTPPFPAYTSGHSGFGAALFRVLELVLGESPAGFTLTTEERDVFDGSTPPQVVASPGPAQAIPPRTFARFDEAEAENGDSRIKLGVHWTFDDVRAGRAAGRQVAENVAGNFLRPAT